MQVQQNINQEIREIKGWEYQIKGNPNWDQSQLELQIKKCISFYLNLYLSFLIKSFLNNFVICTYICTYIVVISLYYGRITAMSERKQIYVSYRKYENKWLLVKDHFAPEELFVLLSPTFYVT